MNTKEEIEKYKINKKVKIEFEKTRKFWSVDYTENGYQWNTAFYGTKKDALIIYKAYLKVGYKK